MPELPEVEAALELLRVGAKGRTIARIRLLHPALQRRLTAAQVEAVGGARIVRVERRGKHQLLHLHDGRILHAHFRMNGDWALVQGDEELPRFSRAVIEFADGGALVFLDSRMLGTIDLHPAGVQLDLGLGPDAADSDWTAEQLGAALATRRGPIKPALLDQSLVAGLGNIYAAESLWRAKISPFAACDSLTAQQVQALRVAIAEVIVRATGSRYTDDDTVELDVYDREGLPCRRCRTPIQRVSQAGRSTFYCPQCQLSAIVGGASAATRSSRGSASVGKRVAASKTVKESKRRASSKKTMKRSKSTTAPTSAKSSKSKMTKSARSKSNGVSKKAKGSASAKRRRPTPANRSR